MQPIKLNILMLTFILTFGLSVAADALADEPDSKSIPKSILMLGLYCNSANSTLKERFENNPTNLPWRAEGKKKGAIHGLMDKLDLNDLGYAKAVRDKAITQEEANFIKFLAIHEANQWLVNINVNCNNHLSSENAYEACLKEANSEIYKCYRQIIDAAIILMKSK